MRDRLKELLNNSYAPYSNFRVSAVVVMKDGTSLPVSKKMFLEEVKENISSEDYNKIIERITKNE